MCVILTSDVVFEAIALPQDTSRQFLLPHPRLGLELSASASPRHQHLLVEFSSK